MVAVMIKDPTPRWHKALDAISQFLNVALLPDHRATTSNESISGRSHRLGWPAERLIDAVFWPLEGPGHCRRAYEADVKRAHMLIANHIEREGKL